MFVFQPMFTVCSPGRTGMMSLLASLRTGMALPLCASAVISASAGSSTRKSSPRLQRSERSSVEVRWRLPSVISCVPRFTVTVAPAMASGRLMARSTLSPGQGCQTGTRSGLPGSKMGARPAMVTFQTGEATRCQRSTHASSARVASLSAGTTARPLSQVKDCSCAPSRTSMKPSLTTALDERTFSPGNSGTRSATALPAGERRVTVVCTCQMRPSSRLRSIDGDRLHFLPIVARGAGARLFA